MLLDEPTNHLDVKNVAWLEDYLTHLPDVTSMVVSHDSGFLDNVCTGIIHYENRKLKHYRVSFPFGARLLSGCPCAVSTVCLLCLDTAWPPHGLRLIRPYCHSCRCARFAPSFHQMATKVCRKAYVLRPGLTANAIKRVSHFIHASSIMSTLLCLQLTH